MKTKAALFLASFPLVMGAVSNTQLAKISDLAVYKAEEALTVNFNVDPKDFKVKSNNYLRITPALVAESDTLMLDPMVVAGRHAWFYEIRNGNTNFAPTLMRAGHGDQAAYSQTVPYAGWMDLSRLVIITDTLSKCNCRPPLSGTVPVADLDYRPKVFSPSFVYETPTEEAAKIFNLSGRANVIFKVNRTDIDWNYAGNVAELAAIIKTIDAVKDNKDATVEAIYLTGYASPEGSYQNNVRLAQGRTEAVKEYVMKHSSFPASIYHTSSVPEDWEGLKEWLATSDLENKQQMIAFIDDKSVPLPEKNDIFRKRFPKEYPFLLKNVYPQLRHTDYRITYSIKQYYDVNEILEVMRTQPGNLSQNELFLVANHFPKGSKESDEAFEMAARLFPDNTTANLNAANAAMGRGDYAMAGEYLDKAGDSADAVYGRAVLNALKGDYQAALPLFEKAEKMGVAKARESIEQINRLNETENVKIL